METSKNQNNEEIKLKNTKKNKKGKKKLKKTEKVLKNDPEEETLKDEADNPSSDDNNL